jgi:hypothetical protein
VFKLLAAVGELLASVLKRPFKLNHLLSEARRLGPARRRLRILAIEPRHFQVMAINRARMRPLQPLVCRKRIAPGLDVAEVVDDIEQPPAVVFLQKR